MTTKQIKNFWNKVDIQGPDECWPWQAYINDTGYGCVGVGCKVYLAHRIAWEITYGPIPESLFCCHKCDNPACINPGHMFLGTHQDNMTDKSLKDRARKGISNTKITGSKHKLSKLTEEQVLEIRRLYALESHILQREIGILFNISDKTVSQIILRQRWKHI